MNKYYNLDTSKLNYVIYCRKSSEGEDKQVQSLETQLRELKDHADKNNLNVVEIITESKSAHTVGRIGFAKLTHLIKTGKANAVLVIRANRISRNAIDAGYIVSLMDEKKLLYIRTPNSTCYTSSSTDKMMIALELIFSKKDSDDKGEMVKEGQKTKAIKGYPHGVATLGFLNDMSDEKGNRKWKVDQVRLNKINLLLRKFLEGGYTGGKLYDYAVNELGLTTVSRGKSGGMPIVRSRIYEILKDPIYAGFFYYGGERYELHKSLPRIITESEHVKILRLLGEHSLPKVQNHKLVYSGLIRSPLGHILAQDVKLQVICDCKRKFSCRSSTVCPDCGTDISKMNSPKLLDYSYHYDNRKKKAKQPYKSITETVITNRLIDIATSDFPLSSDLAQWSRDNLYQLKEDSFQKELNAYVNLEEDKKKFESEKLKARAMLREQKISEDEYKADLADIEERYKHLNKKKSAGEVDWMAKLNEIVSFSESIAEVMKNGSLDQKRKVLFALGSNLTWDDKNLCITWRKSTQALIDGVKGMKAKLPEFEPKLSFDSQGLNEKTSLKRDVFSIMLRE